MAEASECNNCGALLTEEDLFCGECGAPRTVPPAVDDLEVTPEPGASPTASRARPATGGWRLSFVLLLVLGVLACLIAMAAFVLFGVTPTEDFTPTENWLFSAFCCLLPIGAISVALFMAGSAIWFTRLRDR